MCLSLQKYTQCSEKRPKMRTTNYFGIDSRFELKSGARCTRPTNDCPTLHKFDMTYPFLEGDGNALDRNGVLRTWQDDCGKSLVVF